ncbi:MAG: PSD1 and planctomycete cytochrome C domain-containing protein [Gemmataceae bacterium]
MRRTLGLASFALILFACDSRAQAADNPAAAANDFFEKEVRPLLIERCLKCHGDAKPKGGLKLTSRAGVLKGGDTGPAAIAKKPADSLLVHAIRYKDELKMPPKEKLPDREVATLVRWIELGLPWPESTQPIVVPSADKKYEITEDQRRFWAFQPIKKFTPPDVKDKEWPKNDLDRFILAALEAKNLRPAKPSDKRTLIRRVTFDLTGLPPTPEEIDNFLHDQSPDAYAKVIDRLLASPHYGERWGRHWLDVVRYADSFDARGIGGQGDIPAAWRYRDWVVKAFNDDMPYDRFVLDQIAGDLRPAKAAGEVNVDGIIATGMLAIGNWGGGDADKEKLLTDIVDDQIDVVGRTFLGLTIACARCHDHKFDPIPTEDYYGLAGIFFSTHILPNVGPKTDGPPMLRIPLLPAAEVAKRNQFPVRVAQLEKQLQQARDKRYAAFARCFRSETAKYVLAAWDYQHRPGEELKTTVAEFAEVRKLQPYALEHWLDYLTGDDYKLMATPIRDVLGQQGVSGWKGPTDCPSVLVNSTDKEVKLLTFTLPAHSFAMHPGPSNGVVLGWKSPVDATVKISGRLVDADPNGGDGVAWILDHRRAGEVHELASGDLPNAGAQKLSEGNLAHALDSVEIKAGERLELLVLPKANHICDTTTIEFTIAQTDDSAVWDVSKDVVGDILKGNPHADRQGHPDVWSFQDMAASTRGQKNGTGTSSLRAWQRAQDDFIAGKIERVDLECAAEQFEKSFEVADARSPFWIRQPAEEKLLPAEAQSELAKLAAELGDLKKNPPPPVPFAHGVQEGGVPDSPQAGVHNVRVHIRGSYSRLGDVTPRHFPQILGGGADTPIKEGSGRLQLAQWLVNPDHPLTARVMVNRIWQHHFGEGLVRTPSNFGKLGEKPTHPELLDFLARQFIESGWSIKKMHRVLLLSAIYQQASEPPPETAKADADNRLFGHMNRKRLQAEAVRDSLLAVAGKLDLKLGGPATADFNVPRRALYQMTVRSDRSGFGPLFDVADSTAIVSKRIVSTVAPQALFLMNHPFAIEQTKALTQRILAYKGDDKSKIEKAYILLYGRPPTEEELQIGHDFIGRVGKTDKDAEAAWQEYCQILLCANEFVYVD